MFSLAEMFSGDALTPYITGAMNDELIEDPTTYYSCFIGYRNTLFLTCFISVIGGLLFLLAAIYLPEDKKKALMQQKLHEAVNDNSNAVDTAIGESSEGGGAGMRLDGAAMHLEGAAANPNMVEMRFSKSTTALGGAVNEGFDKEEEMEEEGEKVENEDEEEETRATIGQAKTHRVSVYV